MWRRRWGEKQGRERARYRNPNIAVVVQPVKHKARAREHVDVFIVDSSAGTGQNDPGHVKNDQPGWTLRRCTHQTTSATTLDGPQNDSRLEVADVFVRERRSPEFVRRLPWARGIHFACFFALVGTMFVQDRLGRHSTLAPVRAVFDTGSNDDD